MEYIIAINFQATCWQNQPHSRSRISETIEFPAVLMNLNSGQIEAEFHKYIRPTESPILSEYCINLTGISQNTVNNGIPLQTAFSLFQDWLSKELGARNLVLPKMSPDNKTGNCALLTWTDWDFGTCIMKECKRKGLKKPCIFNQWVELRAIFREWYRNRPTHFSDALKYVGLTFEGREHSGIDDARNIARLAFKVVRDGGKMTVTNDLTPYKYNSHYEL